MILRTEAIVLRSIRYGESSRIATLFTRARGRMSVIAKGARRTRSRFGSALLPMSYVEVVAYCKSGRSLQTLSEASHLLRFPSLAKDLRKISIGMRVMELVGAVVQEEETNPGLFNLTLQTLQELSTATLRFENLLPFFELKLAAELGFAPLIDREEVEQISDAGGSISLDRGVISPGRNLPTTMNASRTALRSFAVYAAADAATALRMSVDARTQSEVHTLVEAFMKYHLEEAYPTRGERVFRQIAL